MTDKTTDQQASNTIIEEPISTDELSPDHLAEERLQEQEEAHEDITPIEEKNQDVDAKKIGFKKVAFWVGSFFAFIFASIQFIPNLSTTLKVFGLPDDLPSIQEEFSAPIIPPKVPVRITPEFDNHSFKDNEVTLSLSSEAKQKNCTVKKENGSPAFNIACDGEIGDKIHFTLLSTGCTDKDEKAQLGYPKKSYIKCP